MCNEYEPVVDDARMRETFGVQLPLLDFAASINAFQKTHAPIIRRAPNGDLEAVPARWPFIPRLAKDPNITWSTANARTEDIDKTWSFKFAWRASQRCIVPAESLFEPYWESVTGPNGKPKDVHTRWRIWRRDGRPFGIAGLWSEWCSPDRSVSLLTFSMLTMNADGHGVFGRLHRPDPKRPPDKQDKRSVILLADSDHERWLDAPLAEARALFRLYPAALLSDGAAPALPRKKDAAAATAVDLDLLSRST